MSGRITKCQTIVTSSYMTTIAHAILWWRLWCVPHQKKFMVSNHVRQGNYHKHSVCPHHLWYCLTSHMLCKLQLCACLHTFPLCEPSRIMMHTSLEIVHGCKTCMIRQLTQTSSLPAPFVILSVIAHGLQTATMCMLAHVSSLWTVSDYGAYRKRLCFTNRVWRNKLESIISP